MNTRLINLAHHAAVRSIGSATLLAVCCGYAAAADNLNLTFSANIRETTCDIKIEGGIDNGTSNTITLGTDGKSRVDHVAKGEVNTPFKLVISECPSSLSALKTEVSGTSATKTALANSIDAVAGGAANVGLTIARASVPESPFEINSVDDSKRLVWSPEEISNKEVELLATLVETKTDSAGTGTFETLATFNFTYE